MLILYKAHAEKLYIILHGCYSGFRKLPFYPLNYRTAFMYFSVRLFPRFAHEAEKMRYFEKSPPSYAHLTYSAPHV